MRERSAGECAAEDLKKAQQKVVIAIDGPAGAGKSTVAKLLAEKLNFLYLDTGAMYRAFTLYILQKKIPLDDNQRIKTTLRNFPLKMSTDCICIGDTDVSREIRTPEVDKHVSYISSLDFVRLKMVELQRLISKNKDIVVEGRDVGTVVFPYSRFKFYLDAKIEERARRRLEDKKTGNNSCTFEDMVSNITKRDRSDSTREHSPLRMAPDAVYIDSTNMTVEEVCNFIISKVQR